MKTEVEKESPETIPPNIKILVDEFNKLEHVSGAFLAGMTTASLPKLPVDFIEKFLTELSAAYLTKIKEPGGYEKTLCSANGATGYGHKGRRRSVQEIYDVLKNYYPDSDYGVVDYFRDFLEVIARLHKKGSENNFTNIPQCIFCCTIGRPVVGFFERNSDEYKKYFETYFTPANSKIFPFPFYNRSYFNVNCFWDSLIKEENLKYLVGNRYEK